MFTAFLPLWESTDWTLVFFTAVDNKLARFNIIKSVLWLRHKSEIIVSLTLSVAVRLIKIELAQIYILV